MKRMFLAAALCAAVCGCAFFRGDDEEVVADGPNVTVTLNGHVILAMSVKDCTVFPDGKEHPGLANSSGYLGFLGHTMPVRIRDIRIRELP